MEYLILTGAICIFVILVFFLEWKRNSAEEKQFIKKLYEDYEVLSEKEYAPERFARMGSYYERHKKEGQIDDITWNDLEMDDLFRRMNYTLSASGEEYLYYVLRTPKLDTEELGRLEEGVAFFGENPKERVRIQLLLRKLGYTGKFSLYDYLEHLEDLGERSNRKNIFCNLLFLPLIGCLWVNFSLGILGIVILTIYNILTYFREKAEIDPYIVSFAYIIRLLDVCDELKKNPLPVCQEEWECIKKNRSALQGIRRNSIWVMSPTRGNSSGDIISLFMDYIRMVFHVDLLQFNKMLGCLRGHMQEIDALIGTVGYLESLITIWIFRTSLKEGYCLPEFKSFQEGENQFLLEECYHPLLKHPVKNSICMEKGVLLTGSNASGKSTFLKTVAVNAILSQSVNTCMAKKYEAPLFHVYSSMALRDNMDSGESYYIVEIKALRRILDAAEQEKIPVLCFVDEVLRGTNTVERIAASTQILKFLRKRKVFCFAATHDIELTELLGEEYENYHFEESLENGDVVFHYRLLPGRASTRNAIRLLEMMGYEKEITENAARQAQEFVQTGNWRS